MMMEARNSSVGTPSDARNATDLHAAGEVGRQRPVTGETAEVDNPAHTLLARGAGEVAGPDPVPLAEILLRSHRVYEVVGDICSVEGLAEGIGIEHVARDDVGPAREPAGEVPGRTGEAADSDSTFFERRNEAAADVAASPGDENHSSEPPSQASACKGLRVVSGTRGDDAVHAGVGDGLAHVFVHV